VFDPYLAPFFRSLSAAYLTVPAGRQCLIKLLRAQTDIAISPAGDVWAMNNWQDVDSCYASPPEALSTRCGGQGVVIFFGMAKPVRAPQIGPARGYD
jgi:hypothetical protein